MVQKVKVWYDAEGDFLEVVFEEAPGYMRETENDSVMERVDENGRILGFSITNVKKLSSDHPLIAELPISGDHS